MEFIMDIFEARDVVTCLSDVAPQKTISGLPLGVKIEAFDTGEVVFSVNETSLVSVRKSVAKVASSGSAVVCLETLYKAVIGFSPFNENTNNGVTELRFNKASQNISITTRSAYGKKTVSNKRLLQFLDVSIPGFLITNDGFITMPLNAVVQGLRSVLSSAASNVDSGGFDGVLFSINKGELKTVSMDGVCLTEFVTSVGDLSWEGSCVLSTGNVTKIVKFLYKLLLGNSEGLVDIFINNRMFMFRVGSFVAGFPLLISKFPEYSALFSADRKNFIIDKKIFLDNLKNISFSSDNSDDFRVVLAFYGGELNISTATCENAGIKLEGGGEGNLHIDFNINILERCVHSMLGDKIIFLYKDRHSPVVIKAATVGETSIVRSILAPLR